MVPYPALIHNGVQEKKRSFFVVVGDRSKDVIVNLHYLMSREDMRQNKSVLWAYKSKLLGFTSHRKKRENKIKKEIKRGMREANSEDPFELFVSLHDIRYVYYKETEKILGNTYGMCILQDFEAITPNILARCIETVEGGGLVILLLKGMTSLKQLYTLSMDVHSRYRTEAHDDVVARFNERFILSLGACKSCLVIDDELNVLPISGGKEVSALPAPDLDQAKTPAQKELEGLKESLQDTQPVGSLVSLARTTDQAKALLTFVDAIAEKTLRNTVTLTAGRGRENLKTLFDFVFKGFDALGYADHIDYTIIQSTNKDWNKAIVRVNIHRQHRQTIQYIRPQDAHVLGQAELVVIDEAAAIPLPLVRKLMGPYLVFMASTINGYEGTGRSLSLKLIKQLREQSHSQSANVAPETEIADRSTGRAAKNESAPASGRSLREITLSEPIRYAQGDGVEKWLNGLLCLDATLPRAKNNIHGCPDPTQCQLLRVNRDTLFSFHPVSERFLQQMIALYVASHYKNSPNDLQLMSDAPAHELFVLVPPISEDSQKLPEPLCVIQVALEGKISRQSVLNSLGRGQRPAGDLIPWLVSQQFQDEEFASLSGARVVRIATNPDYVSMGYGSKALELLVNYYDRQFNSLSEDEPMTSEDTFPRVTDEELAEALEEKSPAAVDYVGVSYGLTPQLHKFWQRATFAPVYLRQTPNELTGEHTCVMIRPLDSSGDRSWLGAFARDFHRRFLSLLSYDFRTFHTRTALSLDESTKAGAELDKVVIKPLRKTELDELMTPFDLKRLDSYSKNMFDYRVILDLVPTLAMLYFSGRLRAEIKLTGVQECILLSIGLQRKDLDVIAQDLTIQPEQVLPLFNKIVRKITTHFATLVENAVEAEMPKPSAIGISRENASGAHDDEVNERFEPFATSLEDDLQDNSALTEMEKKKRELIDSLPLDQYEVEGDAPGWDEAEQQVLSAAKHGKRNVVVSVKSSKTKRKAGTTAAEIYEKEIGQKERKKVKLGRKAKMS
ncbi:unnamed protein product [Parascedosporium putredinis]|uniref:RNA cytidine acetyltransferase n=1 Tax=Parascedosporium putredinis TaxID=1442378 RepID=A0A9P1H8Q1_9PEZI|nr:unnamed protein product [Parascedosporium putredinis]CAI8002322.1 unnamed protein product [Parascedosporium putredinis]